MRDNHGNIIQLLPEPNGHVLILGQTGQGKTYELCRLVEEYCGQGKRMFIVDYSGSFTEQELEKQGLKDKKCIRRINVAKEEFTWDLRVQNHKDVAADIADALLLVMRCEAYPQHTLLHKVIEELFEKKRYVNIPEVIRKLEHELWSEQVSESLSGNIDALGRLLTRLGPYKRLSNFYIRQYEATSIDDNYLIQIVDLTNLPQQQRDFLSMLLVSLLWKEVYRQEIDNRCEILILDEIQHLSLAPNSAVAGILREGRKRNLSAVLSTQLTGKYNKVQVQTLQQAGNIILFRPADDEIRTFAQMIDSRNSKIWIEKLSNLERGQAILKGNYTVNGRQRRSPIQTPIIIRT